jgi:Tol biopolymer transport system component
LVLRELRTGNDTQIVAPDAVMYPGLTFSPDGNDIYYTASSKGNPLFSSLYKIPTRGGQATRIVEDIDTSVSFSPDGKQFAFVRGVPDKGENDVIVANADGSDLKVIAKRPGQVYWQALLAPAWSPDGKTIVFVNYQAPSRRALMAVGPDGTSLREIYTTHSYLGRPQWLRDGSGVVVPIREENVSERGQLWAIGFPAGQAQKLTTDLTDYNISWLDLDRGAAAVAAVETTITGDLWILPDGDSDHARQVATGDSPVFSVTTFGKDHILYQTRDNGIFVADTDGANPKQLLGNRAGIQDVSGCGDGKHVVYGQVVGDESNIWRANADGSGATQLTHEKDAAVPVCSPDGQWLLYWNDAERNLHKISIAGGDSTKMDFPNMNNPFARISPDGKFVLYGAENEKGPRKPYLITIAKLGGNGRASATEFDAVAGMGMGMPQWSRDGQGFYLNLTRQGAANIWKMESPGGALKQVTNFPSGLIASFAWSQDGKTLYVARGTRSNDVLLLRAAR